MDSAISVSGLTKKLGDVLALNGLDVEVKKGEIHGLLGLNGSGKTTTIRTLMGLLRADSGTAQIFGHDAWLESVAAHRLLTYVPADVVLWPRLTGGEAIAALGRLRGGTDTELQRKLIDRFGLDPTRRGRTYSPGDRRKIALIAAFAADTELLLFDEPTTGLDPLTEAVFGECIAEHAARGRTALITSDSLTDIRNRCTSVTIIRDGRAAQSGTVSELDHFTRTTITATTHIGPTPIRSAPGVHNLRRTDAHNTVVFDVDADQIDPVMTTLTGLGIVSISATPPSLADVFLHGSGNDSNASAVIPGATQ